MYERRNKENFLLKLEFATDPNGKEFIKYAQKRNSATQTYQILGFCIEYQNKNDSISTTIMILLYSNLLEYQKKKMDSVFDLFTQIKTSKLETIQSRFFLHLITPFFSWIPFFKKMIRREERYFYLFFFSRICGIRLIVKWIRGVVFIKHVQIQLFIYIPSFPLIAVLFGAVRAVLHLNFHFLFNVFKEKLQHNNFLIILYRQHIEIKYLIRYLCKNFYSGVYIYSYMLL